MSEPVAAVAVAVAGAAYASGVRRLARRGRRWPARRSLAFFAGLLVAAVATQSPLEASSGERFTSHVVQHLLLGMVTPVLVVLGAPLTLALQAASRGVRPTLAALAGSRVVSVVTHPGLAWLVFVGSLFALWFSPLYRLSLRHDVVHHAVHVHFVAAGILFFWPLVGRDPTRWRLPHGLRLLSLALTLPFHAFLGMAVMGAARPTLSPAPAPAALADQRLGGAVLWLAGDLFALGVLGLVAFRWVAEEERRASREEWASEAGVNAVRPAGRSRA